MSVAQTRAARRKIKLRYKGEKSAKSVAQAIIDERQKAARAIARKK